MNLAGLRRGSLAIVIRGPCSRTHLVVDSQYSQKIYILLCHSAELPMELSVAIKLIEKGVSQSSKPQVWADLGAGRGLFTSALSSLLSNGSMIHAVDQDAKALASIKLSSSHVALKTIGEDFIKMKTELKELDGILMANSLHFVSDKITLLKNLKTKLTPSGRFIVIEYDMSTSNRWVPFPIKFDDLKLLADQLNLSATKLGEQPSVYNSSMIYSAVLAKS